MLARSKSMPTGSLSVIIHNLLADAALGAGGMTDGEFLAHFLSSRDDNALAALVRRHAPMVWRLCDRLLRNHHDAEDAFQAVAEPPRSEEHTSELQSRQYLVCRLLLEKKKI